MARANRIPGEWGYLHLIVRGVGRQNLFETRGDYIKYLIFLKRFSDETGVKICCYCLMSNHVHLLVYDPDKNVPLFMKKLGVAYSGYFNRKYERSGHLFQDRYKSEAIESEEYLLTVFRYILNNPREAGICAASEYAWSSYKKYGEEASFVDTSVFRELLGPYENYAAFIEAKYPEAGTGFEGTPHDDEWARRVMRNSLNIENGMVLQSWSQEKRNGALRVLKEKGLSIRQIERLTGINRNMIQRA